MSAEATTIRLETAAAILRGRANRHAWYGLLAALVTLLLATVLACYVSDGALSLDGLIRAQKTNPALWVLNLMPFLFLFFGQYTGTVMSYQAGAMVLDETRELREQATRLESELARRDSHGQQLGLPGRRLFRAELRRSLSHPQAGQTAAVLVLDSEQYPEIRQSAGEEAAQEFAAHLARRLKAALGDDGQLAHFGDDNFAILTRPHTEPELPLRLAQRIQLAMETPIRVDGEPLGVRVAIGIRTLDDGDDPDALIRQAETAKFAARAEGRDYLSYKPSLRSERGEQLRLSADLHAALFADGLCAEYVEQMALVEGTKARLRMRPFWPHPRRGRLEADDFLNIGTRPSLSETLAIWQLREGLMRFAAARRGGHCQQLVVRLPDAVTGRSDLTERLTRLLAAHDLPPDSLVLELREAALLAQPARAHTELGVLRGEGVNLCLYGIGACGASLAAVVDFPINEVRLADGAIGHALLETRVRTLLEHSADGLRAIGVSLTASGVRDDKELALARQLGCHWAEGPHPNAKLSATA